MNDQERFPLQQDAGLAAQAAPTPMENTPASAAVGTLNPQRNALGGMLVILERLAKQVKDDAPLAEKFDNLMGEIRRRING